MSRSLHWKQPVAASTPQLCCSPHKARAGRVRRPRPCEGTCHLKRLNNKTLDSDRCDTQHFGTPPHPTARRHVQNCSSSAKVFCNVCVILTEPAPDTMHLNPLRRWFQQEQGRHESHTSPSACWRQYPSSRTIVALCRFACVALAYEGCEADFLWLTSLIPGKAQLGHFSSHL